MIISTARTPKTEETVSNMVEEDPKISTREIANNSNIEHVLVWRILHDFLVYPYHIQKVMLLRDFSLLNNFCQWLLRK